MMVALRSEATEREIIGKDILFVCDTSGSMAGEKMEHARQALRAWVERPNPDDTFNILRFSTDVEQLAETSLRLGREPRPRARFVNGFEASGGTAIAPALSQALAVPARRGAPRMVVFSPTGCRRWARPTSTPIIQQARERNTANAQVFVFGLGDDVNTTFPRPPRPAEPRRRRLTPARAPSSRPCSPASTTGSLLPGPRRPAPRCAAPTPTTFTPATSARSTAAASSWSPAATAPRRRARRAHRHGRQRRRAAVFDWPVALPPERPTTPSSRVWATRKTGYLLDEIRLHENPELRESVVSLPAASASSPRTPATSSPSPAPCRPSTARDEEAGPAPRAAQLQRRAGLPRAPAAVRARRGRGDAPPHHPRPQRRRPAEPRPRGAAPAAPSAAPGRARGPPAPTTSALSSRSAAPSEPAVLAPAAGNFARPARPVMPERAHPVDGPLRSPPAAPRADALGRRHGRGRPPRRHAPPPELREAETVNAGAGGALRGWPRACPPRQRLDGGRDHRLAPRAPHPLARAATSRSCACAPSCASCSPRAPAALPPRRPARDRRRRRADRRPGQRDRGLPPLTESAARPSQHNPPPDRNVPHRRTVMNRLAPALAASPRRFPVRRRGPRHRDLRLVARRRGGDAARDPAAARGGREPAPPPIVVRTVPLPVVTTTTTVITPTPGPPTRRRTRSPRSTATRARRCSSARVTAG